MGIGALGLVAATSGLAAAQDVAWTVQAEETPEKKPWTDPASIAFKSVENGEDYFDIAVALTATKPLPYDGDGARAIFANAAAIRRTNPGKEQEYYAFKVGLKQDFYSHDGVPLADEYAIYLDPSVSYNRTTTFRDLNANCAVAPKPATCADQYEGSVRAELKGQLFLPWFLNNPPYKDGDHWVSPHPAYVEFGPIANLFHDRIVDAKTDAKGLKLKGSASGAQSTLSLIVIPKAFDYRLSLRASEKYLLAFDRTGPRAAAFPANASLFTASASWDFGPRAFETAKGWAPSFAVTYTDGDDPLTARAKSKDTTFQLRIAYTQ